MTSYRCSRAIVFAMLAILPTALAACGEDAGTGSQTGPGSSGSGAGTSGPSSGSGASASTASSGGGASSSTASSGSGGGGNTGCPAPGLDLPCVPWEGGPAYWGKFPKASAAGWTDPAFFPIGVWLETAYNASFLKSVGINLHVGMNHDGADIADIAAQTGIFFIAQDEWSPAEVGNNPNVVGWLASDECDMGYSGCDADPIAQNQSHVDAIKARNDGRFAYANYGKGALGTFWNPQNLPALVQMVDVASDDLYFFTDPNLPGEAPQSMFWPSGAEVRAAASYGWTLGRMSSFQGAELHPTWNFVELGHPAGEANAPTVTPDEMEGASWASIIEEARGLVFFNHSFGGACQSQHVLSDCDPAMRDRVASMTAKIEELAPVLNSQSHEWSAGDSGVETMLKVHEGSLYLFAQIGQKGAPGSHTLTLPNGLAGTAEVVFENRSVTVAGAELTDDFASTNTVHVYKLVL